MSGENLNKKIFEIALSSILIGKDTSLKIRGNKKEMKAITEAFRATKNFHEELYKEDASLESISLKLQEKREKIAEFEKIIGIRWPI
jgi:peptidoglycan hydrolase CwlO-like protein